MRSYVIGDIHGCLDELRYLIEDLPIKSGDRLIFLGDYVDRGPNSKGVLTYILQLQKREDRSAWRHVLIQWRVRDLKQLWSSTETVFVGSDNRTDLAGSYRFS